MSEKLFNLCQDDLGNYEIRYDDKVFHFLWEVAPILNEQQAAINELQDTVYDELDKALKVLEEIYEDYPKNNVHRLYNNLKGLKEMIR